VLDVVLLYGPPWSGPTRFSKHHLASYFARRGARVLYVESPLTAFGLRRGRRFAAELGVAMRPPQLVTDRLWVRRHFLPVPYHAATWPTRQRAANRLGQRLLAPTIRRDLKVLGFTRPLLIAGLPHAADVVPLLPRSGTVYHCADDYAHVRGFPPGLPRLEAELCRRADLVIATSQTLCQERRHFNPATYWVPNGADVEHFSERTDPALELRNTARPIVGFVGGLSEWVDLALVGDLARARPSWSFVLVGPASIDTSAIRDLPNVQILGPRPYVHLPAYLAAMDVALIPFKHNPLTYHADPIKAYEYLAAGLPVVATDLPALRRLAEVVRLADSAAEFLAAVDAAVLEGREKGRVARQAEASHHGWTARFESIERLIHEHLPCAS
jgi:glycosyltransferase involved in cell wall biosynthesis